MNKIKVIIHLETEEDIIGIKEDAAAYFEKYADVKRIEVENEITNIRCRMAEQWGEEDTKHAHWIIENDEKDWKDNGTYRLYIKCSKCGKTHFLGTTKYRNEYNKEKLKKLGNYADYLFCGRCGAKMEEM